VKLKIGPGVSDITMYDRDGDLLIGRDDSDTWLQKISVTEVSLRMGAGRLPILTLEIELIGYEIELDVAEENIVADLNRRGITRIEGRKEANANLHPDA
jgi:hypothetical protein